MRDERVRVAILGNSGSGKSTLARWLAARSAADVDVLDLDTIAWQPGADVVLRPEAEARADVAAFCRAREHWVVEGCYASLVGAALAFAPLLVLLDPGTEQCVANCRSRPWEPHKYASQAEQDARLEDLLSWVRDYDVRDGDLSRAEHRAAFAAYDGPKLALTSPPSYDPPSPELLRCLR